MQRRPSHQLDLNKLSTLEETAYEQGFSEGQEHGKLHGLFEGRQLGLLKGFEIWEEIGYMEGIARFHLGILPSLHLTRKEGKQRQQLEVFLQTISSMSMKNDEDVNLFDSLERIRGRFKMVCQSLGISSDRQEDNDQPQLVQIHGKAVDSSQLNF